VAPGTYQLDIPYSNPLELVMEILKNGPDVEVIDPPALRQAVRERLVATLKLYTNAKVSDVAESRVE
jgi:predicted DNA-binding transcriptional regulator YafY